jgi:hypothetical protein
MISSGMQGYALLCLWQGDGEAFRCAEIRECVVWEDEFRHLPREDPLLGY